MANEQTNATDNTTVSSAVIQLLTEIRDTQAATAILLRSIQAELAAPRLEREALDAQKKCWAEQRAFEADQCQARAALKDAEERRTLPKLFGGGVGVASMVELPPDSEREPST